MTLQRLDTVVSVLLALFGCGVIVYAARYGFTQDRIPGPGFFPMISGVMIAVLSVVNLIRSLSGVEKLEGGIGARQALSIAGICGLLLLYVFAAPYLGLLLPLPFVLVALAYLIEPKPGLWPFAQMAALSVCFTIVCGYLFGTVLGVLLPAGPLGF